MKDQFDRYPVSSVMVFGVAGGNGLEHIDAEKFSRIYGVDINPLYLEETAKRYPNLAEKLECICLDLAAEADKLPHADLVIANLLIEYIGCDAFAKAVKTADSEYVSCMIQINEDTAEQWVSDSPYLHVFDGLDRVHHEIDPQAVTKALAGAGYELVETIEYPLPNGKKLVRLDYMKKVES